VAERFPARRSRGGDVAVPLAGVLLFVALASLVLGASREPGPAMLVLCAVAGLLAIAGTFLLLWGIAYQRLAYALTESALRIDWLGRTLVVPYRAIQGIYTGQRLSGQATPGVPRWPGISVGPARRRGLGRLRFFATSTDQSLLTLITVEHGGVIVSAHDPTAFRAALIAHVEAYGEIADHAADSQIWQQKAPAVAPWTAFADGWLIACVAIGLLALLVLLGTITLRYDALPDLIPLRFEQVEPKSGLLRLPLLGLVCLATNWVAGVLVHVRERVLARLLWLGGVVVQAVLLIGVLGVFNRA
jgi:hypothetical protein